MLLAILKVRPRAIDPVRQDPFRIMSRAFPIPLDSVFQNGAFIIRGERDLLQASMAFLIDADVVFGAKLYG